MLRTTRLLQISMSYGKSQGLPEHVLGILQSSGAVLGSVSAILYTVLERRFGVVPTGFCGLLVRSCSRFECSFGALVRSSMSRTMRGVHLAAGQSVRFVVLLS